MFLKRIVFSTLAAAAVTSGILFGATAPASAATQVKYYDAIATCHGWEDYYAATGRHIEQGCTADAYVNGVPVRWRLMIY